MLVLSRRETEKVLFPTLGISVEILRIRGNSTRLGIDAPADIPVLRHEIAQRNLIELTPDASSSSEQLRDLVHVVRKRLDSAATALNRLHQQFEEGGNQIAQQVVMDLYCDLQSLEREANRALEGTPAAQSLTVLVVEDSIFERKLLGGALAMSGMNVVESSDGQEALDFLSMHAMPDAVLLDMLMPHCDGPAFVQTVRSDSRFTGLKIFAVSSTDPSTLGLVIGQGGLDGWFPKPLEPGELICVLSEQLNGAADKTVKSTLTLSTSNT